MRNIYSLLTGPAALLLAGLFLSGCSSTPDAEDATDAYLTPDELVTDFDMIAERDVGTIYSENANILVGTGRSYRIGDLIVIEVQEDIRARDSAGSSTTRNHTFSNDVTIDTGSAPTKMALGIKSGNQFVGRGENSQSHSIQGNLTVTVVKVYPNGNLAVAGKKRVSLKNGTETIGLSGIIREADIDTATNSVPSSKLANAQIVYLGEGEIHEGSNKGWASRFLSGAWWPF